MLDISPLASRLIRHNDLFTVPLLTSVFPGRRIPPLLPASSSEFRFSFDDANITLLQFSQILGYNFYMVSLTPTIQQSHKLILNCFRESREDEIIDISKSYNMDEETLTISIFSSWRYFRISFQVMFALHRPALSKHCGPCLRLHLSMSWFQSDMLWWTNVISW